MKTKRKKDTTNTTNTTKTTTITQNYWKMRKGNDPTESWILQTQEKGLPGEQSQKGATRVGGLWM